MTPIQAHPHRCPVANEAKAAEAIRDLLKKGILKNVSEPVLWISNSVYRKKPEGSTSLCVFIDHSQTRLSVIKMHMLKNPVPTVDELLPKLNNANAYSCVKVHKRFTNVELDKGSSFL